VPAAALPPPQFATKRLQIIPKEGRKQIRAQWVEPIFERT